MFNSILFFFEESDIITAAEVAVAVFYCTALFESGRLNLRPRRRSGMPEESLGFSGAAGDRTKREGSGMMPELSLNILDVAQNSVAAGATLVEIGISADQEADRLAIVISDNGSGMTPEQVRKVTDPFYTTRTTRAVGLGVPFFKMAAETAGGSFQIESVPGAGTKTTAVFQLSHIDRMPLGNLAATMTALIGPNPDMDFVLSYKAGDRGFDLDTRAFKAVLGDVKLDEPEILAYIDNFVQENIMECGDLT